MDRNERANGDEKIFVFGPGPGWAGSFFRAGPGPTYVVSVPAGPANMPRRWPRQGPMSGLGSRAACRKFSLSPLVLAVTSRVSVPPRGHQLCRHSFPWPLALPLPLLPAIVAPVLPAARSHSPCRRTCFTRPPFVLALCQRSGLQAPTPCCRPSPGD